MKTLESLSIDEYYQTVATFFKINDERKDQLEKLK